jgi:hypothetical protein
MNAHKLMLSAFMLRIHVSCVTQDYSRAVLNEQVEMFLEGFGFFATPVRWLPNVLIKKLD